MPLNVDQEILQDFLVEGGELLESLGEQLVELENSPDDKELLNSVFRGFHTIKGGASFLNLATMVDICHRAEDVFNVLRNGERRVDAQLMDVILPVVDVLNAQFEDLRNDEEPAPVATQMLQALEQLATGGAAGAEDGSLPAVVMEDNAGDAPPELTAGVEGGQAEITGDEYEQLLDALDETPQPAGETAGVVPSEQVGAGDDITEDEFDMLLDQLHGPGRHGGAPAKKNLQDREQHAAVDLDKGKDKDKGDDITEDEFDALLDKLHGPVSKQELVKEDEKAGATVAVGVKGKDSVVTKTKEKSVVQAEATVRVDTRRLDDIMNLVGELVLVRNRLTTLEAVYNDEEMTKVATNLDVVTSDLQAAVMKTRMQPIKKVFGRFPRVVRDLARSLNKEVSLEMQGEDTDLDKNLVEALADPLVHLVRNAVDHGVEMPDVRERAGKPRVATIILSASQEGDHILLRIEDDGAGMDVDILRKKAVEKGLFDSETVARMDDKECYNLIFLPGFSTKDEISDISGRGVGLDVVKNRIAQLNGVVEIDSKLGQGTSLTIKVPLTLAIMPTLMVMLKTQIFALPLVNVSEIIQLDLSKTNVIDRQLVVMVREKALPLFYLRHWLVKNAGNDPLPQDGHIVVVSVGAQKVGFVVDHLIGQEEVVIKPLGTMLLGTKGLAGATITGDGRIAVILDVPNLMMAYARRR